MADDKDWKPVPIDSSALIPLGEKVTNFASMTSVNDLRTMKARAVGHPDPAPHLEDNAVGRSMQERIPLTRKPKEIPLSKGVTVYDKLMKKKGVIIKANAGETKKTHTPVHRLADARGDSWLAKSTDLKPIS